MNTLDGLAPPASKRLAVRVTNDALRQVRGGHPWVFDGSIVSVDKVAGAAGGATGDLAVIFDGDRKFAAIGLFDPNSPIRIRIIHRGKPANIDDEWWAQHVRAAVSRRNNLASSRETTGYRVIHGENDGFPGLVVDRYASTLVVKLYSDAWVPHLAAVVKALQQQLEPERVMLRLSREVGGRTMHGLRDGDALVGDRPTEPILFREWGLTFEADVVHGQKTGHFLDQRHNRNMVKGLAHGRRVLDVFSCTGGFSVYAAAGGATSVRSVDLSAAALATAQRNMLHNSGIAAVRACSHTIQVGDAFDVMRALVAERRKYDIVIVDPPSFARKNSEHQRAINAYQKLTKLALDLVEPEGILVQSSCSSRVTSDEFFTAIRSAVSSTRHTIAEMVRTGHDTDHPIGFPEGAYLKTLFAARHALNSSEAHVGPAAWQNRRVTQPTPSRSWKARLLGGEFARSVLSVWAWLVFGTLVGLWLPLMAIVRVVTAPFDKGRYWTGYLFRKLPVVHQHLNPLWKFRVSGPIPKDPRRPYIVVSNHESFVDILLISHLPFEMKWLAKAEMFKIPVVGWLMSLAGDIRLTRGEISSATDAMKQCEDRLEKKVSVMIFPEGTRSDTGEMGKFKNGAFRLAIDTGTPILPVAVTGTRTALRPKDWRFGYSTAEVRVLEPVEVAGLTHKDMYALRDRVRTAIAAETAAMRAEHAAAK